MRSPPDQSLVTHPLHVARQAALVGAGSAIPGLLVGATYGTLRTQTPVLFSLVSGAQWFAIGTAFWGFRTCILDQTGLLNWTKLTRGALLVPRPAAPSHSDRVRASTIAGGLTGFTLGFLFRGPRNVIPGTIMFSLFGFGGQHAYEFLDRRNSAEVMRKREMQEQGEVAESWLQKLSKRKWSPMKALSDEEYEAMMKDKILVIDAEIAVIDDKIKALEKQKEEMNKKEAEGKENSQ